MRMLTIVVGCTSILFWSTTGIMMCTLIDLPPTEVLLLTQGIACLWMLSWSGLSGKLRGAFPQWRVSSVLGLFFGLNQMAFALSYRFAPPEQLELIAYLWPLFLAIGGALLLRDPFSPSHLVGVGVAFAGICLLLVPQLFFHGVSLEYIPGYLLSLLGALCWTAYCLIARKAVVCISATLGVQLLASLAMILLAHAILRQEWVAPSGCQWLLLGIYGLFVNGIGVALWGWAMRQKHGGLLNSLAYFTPILALLWLVAFGKAAVSVELAISASCVMFGCYLTKGPASKQEATEEELQDAA